MKRLRFLVSLITQENDFQLEQAADAQETSRRLGVDIEIIYAGNDAITQSTQILRAIQAPPETRPDAIVFEPAGGTAFPQVARAAVSAGIGWVVLNREANYLAELRRSSRVPVFSVTSDHVAIGKIQAQQYAALLPKGGSVLYIQGPSESSAAKDRTAGMQKLLPPNIQITALRGQWTEESAHKSVASWLKLNLLHRVSIDLIGSQNDVMAVGARKAFEEVTNFEDRERWLRLPFTGVDGLPQTGQSWVKAGTLKATVVVPPNTGQALTMLTEAINKSSAVPERTFTVATSMPTIDKLSR